MKTKHKALQRPWNQAAGPRALLLLLAWLATALVPPAAQATQPGINGRIAYTKLVDTDTALSRHAVFIDGQQFTHPVPRSPGSDSDTTPAWSPDGKRLAFVRYLGDVAEYSIWVVDQDGANLRKVVGWFDNAGNPTALNRVFPASLVWSPDGKEVGFFSINTATGSHAIRSVDVVPAPNGNPGIRTLAYNGVLSNPASFDWGNDGILHRCMGISRFCTSSPGGGGISSITDLPLEGTATVYVSSARWLPQSIGSAKAMFNGVYNDSGTPSLVRFGVWSILPYEQATGTRHDDSFVKHTRDSEDTVSCTNPASGGSTTTTYQTRYRYDHAVPSPDGKYFVVKRSETEPTYAADGTCTFRTTRIGLYVLRHTGALQRTVDVGNAASGFGPPAWQPSPGNLSIVVTDGHDDELSGLKVELFRRDDGSAVGAAPENTTAGTYIFSDVVPGEYKVRVTLTDQQSEAFEVRHEGNATEAAWLERPLNMPVDALHVSKAFSFEDGTDVLDSNIPQSSRSRLEGMAAIYFQTRRFVDWVHANLTTAPWPRVPIYAFASAYPRGAMTPDGGLYAADQQAIFLGTTLSDYDQRDGIHSGTDQDAAPVNAEWHEFAHHLHNVFVIPGLRESCSDFATSINHAGYVNATSCDSMIEGFATFLAARASADLDGSAGDYIGITNLEDHTHAWGQRFIGPGQAPELGGVLGLTSTEDFAVAALLWDLVDEVADAESTQVIAHDLSHRPVTYTDTVRLPLPELWAVLTSDHSSSVYSLNLALRRLPQYAALTQDLDADGLNDVSAADPVFLMHGFFPITDDQYIAGTHDTYHYSIAAMRLGYPDLPVNFFIGLSDHYAFNFAGLVSKEYVPRTSTPVATGANLGIHAEDASGTPLEGVDLDVTVHYSGSDRTHRRRLGGSDTGDLVHLELPMYFDYLLPVDAPELPPCDPTRGTHVSVTLGASINGYASTDAPGFDSCEYLQALALGSGPAALSYTLRFPEDSLPPTTTIITEASSPVSQGYTEGVWKVAVSCADPVDGGFASGCLRAEYSLDGGEFLPYTDVVEIAALGLHSFAYRSLDAAHNIEATRSVDLGVSAGPVDHTPPSTEVYYSATVSSPIADSTMGTWYLGLSACDDSVVPPGETPSGCARTEYSVDGGPFQALDQELVIGGIGTHTILYRSIDMAGNVEPDHTLNLTVIPPSDVDGDGLLDPEDNCSMLANPDQRDTDYDNYGNRCDADLDNNGIVDSADISILRSRFGSSDADADLGGNGIVNFADLAIAKALFGKPPGPSGWLQ